MTNTHYKGLPIDFNKLEWVEDNNGFYAKQGIWDISVDISKRNIDEVYVRISIRPEPDSIMSYGYNGICNPFTVEYKIQELAFKTLTACMKYQDPNLTARDDTRQQLTKDTVKGLLNVTT